jgi:signal peptidase I
MELLSMSAHQPDILRLFEDILRNGTDLRIRVTGRSMTPFLRGGEIVTIKKVSYASLQIGDLIFCKSRNTSPLLHRIVRKQRTDHGLLFQTKGDAVRGADEPVSEHEILGKVCIIEKNFFGMGTKHVHMGSRFWKTINYLLAIMSSFRFRMCLAVSR